MGTWLLFSLIGTLPVVALMSLLTRSGSGEPTLMLLSDDITAEDMVGVRESQKLDYRHLLP